MSEEKKQDVVELTSEELEQGAGSGPIGDLAKKTKPCPKCGKTIKYVAISCDCGCA